MAPLGLNFILGGRVLGTTISVLTCQHARVVLRQHAWVLKRFGLRTHVGFVYYIWFVLPVVTSTVSVLRMVTSNDPVLCTQSVLLARGAAQK